MVIASTVADSIVMEGCADRRRAMALDGSILGRNVEVRHAAAASHRLVVGDQSRVEVD